MRLTDIRIFKTNGHKVKANCLITLDDAFVYKCKIIEGKNGLFVGMPYEEAKDRDGNTIMENGYAKKYDFHYFKDQDLKKQAEQEIIAKFQGENQEADQRLSQASQGNFSAQEPDELPF